MTNPPTFSWSASVLTSSAPPLTRSCAAPPVPSSPFPAEPAEKKSNDQTLPRPRLPSPGLLLFPREGPASPPPPPAPPPSPARGPPPPAPPRRALVAPATQRGEPTLRGGIGTTEGDV